MSSGVSRSRWGSVATIACVLCTLGAAAPVVHVSSSPNDNSEATSDCKSRIRAELFALGFAIDGHEELPAIAEIIVFPTRVTVVVHRPEEDLRIELPYSRRKGGARAVAVRVSELVRGALTRDATLGAPSEPLESAPEVQSHTAAPLAPEPALPPESAGPQRGGRVSLDLGGAVLSHGAGTAVAAAPALRAWWHVSPSLALRMSAIGPSVGPELDRGAARVVLRQEMLGIELTRLGLLGQSWPLISAGFGAYHVQARGHAELPLTGRADGAWAATIDVGAGAVVPVTGAFALLLELHAIALVPRPVIAAEASALPLGRPLVVGTLTFRAKVL